MNLDFDPGLVSRSLLRAATEQSSGRLRHSWPEVVLCRQVDAT